MVVLRFNRNVFFFKVYSVELFRPFCCSPGGCQIQKAVHLSPKLSVFVVLEGEKRKVTPIFYIL